MRRCFLGTLLAFSVLALTGCWDVKDLNDYNFVTALGIERTNQKYVVYTEVLDVGSVGKQKTGTVNGPKPVWVGKAEGDSVLEAMTHIYKTSQQRLMWDHIFVLILSDSVLQEDLSKLLDGIFRFREIRYTPWVFATRSPIERMMQNPPFVNESPMLTLSHHPQEILKLQSLFVPIRLLTIGRYYNEPGASLLIPSLQIDDASWKSDRTAHSVLKVDGAYAVRKGVAAWLSDDQLKGYRWVNRQTHRMNVTVRRGDKPLAIVRIDQHGTKIGIEVRNGRPQYAIRIAVKGYVQELLGKATEADLTAEIRSEIESQVTETFQAAIAKEADIYQLEHVLYRERNAEWTRLKSQSRSALPEADSLARVSVEVHLNNSGIYQLR